MKNKNNLICILLKKSMFVALILFGPVALYAQVSNVVELTYSGSTISDAIQTSTFAPEVTETQADGVLELDIANLSDQDTMYTIEFANVVDISADPNMHVRIKSDSSMEYLGVKLVDDLGNFTTGNTNDDIIFLPGVEDKFLNYSFSAGSNTQATIQKELSAHNVDSTQIKKIIFFNNSGEAFTGKIWFNYFKLSTPDGDNGVELTDTTFYAPFNGERQFGNGLEGIAMDSKGRIGIAQDDALTISLNENLGEHKYLTVFIFETLLDLSNDNAEFHFQMKSDIEVTLLYRFEDVNGNRVDLVDMVPEVSDEMSTYRFDVNHRFTSNPDFDPTQIKEFHIRKLSSEGVNGTLVLDDFYLGIPYFDLYKNDYTGSTISDNLQTSSFDDAVTATQADGALALVATDLAVMDTLYRIQFDRPLDISQDPNLFARIKSNAPMADLGVKLVDINGNATSGTSKSAVMELPGVEDRFLTYSFSSGSNEQPSIQDELTANNVDSTKIKEVIFFNNSEAAFTGTVWFDYLQLSTPDTDNGAMLTDTTFYAPFNGERQFGNGIEAIAMDNNGRIGIYQNETLTISMRESLGEHSYLTAFLFSDSLDVSNENSYVKFKMKSDIAVSLLLRYEDYNGERIDLVDFVPEVSDTFVTYAFSLNHRFLSNPGFKPEEVKEFHFRKLDTEPFNGTLVIDDFQIGFKDTEAPTAPSNLMLTEVTDTSATLTWEAASDEYGVFAYKVYANDELLGTTVGLQMSVDDLEGTVTFKVVASDRAGNDSEPSNEETATFEVTSINNLSDLDNLIKVFPNPAQEVIYIRCDQIKLQSVELISTAGSQVNIMKKDNSHNTYSIDLSALPEGMYIIKIQTEHGLITKPVIKE
jgi:hypothetical protein